MYGNLAALVVPTDKQVPEYSTGTTGKDLPNRTVFGTRPHTQRLNPVRFLDRYQHPFRDGTTHVLFERLDLMALVPRSTASNPENFWHSFEECEPTRAEQELSETLFSLSPPDRRAPIARNGAARCRSA